MDNLDKKFEKLGVKIPDILLPDDSINLNKWAVVACDQFTAQPEYWEDVSTLVGDSPSALKLILPEVYLEKSDLESRIDTINSTMEQYLRKGILKNRGSGFVYVKRIVPGLPPRKGLLAALDLEKYDYREGAKALIRPTEGTVVDRLPPRVKIRSNAYIELPHILVLFDDEDECVIEPLDSLTAQMEKLYEFELMKEGGSISGYMVRDKSILEQIYYGLSKLADRESFREKHQVKSDGDILMYAVGDGNHSLAAAKSHWENLKTSNPGIDKHHPARYALVELLNIHDKGIIFEPIHRVVFNTQPRQLLDSLVEWFRNRGTARYKIFSSIEQLDDFINNSPAPAGSHLIRFICKEGHGCIWVDSPEHQLAVGTLQAFLDSYLSSNKTAKVDYIHGEDVATHLGSQDNNIGFFLPSMDKSDFFKTIIKDGVLPRKTFSMGEASGKRYYIEARLIRTV